MPRFYTFQPRTIKRFGLLSRTFIKVRKTLREVVMSDFAVHVKEAFPNYRQAQETTHEKLENFYESLGK